MRSALLVFLVLVPLVSLAACAQDLSWKAVEKLVRTTFPDVPQLATDSLASWMADGATQPFLLDAREAEEYAVSHLPGAVHIAPDTQDFSALDSLDRHAPIVVYCSVGYRSSALTQRLQAAGFTDVWNLEGSIFRWANEGRPVYRDGEPVELVHPFDRRWGLLLDAKRRAPMQ